MQKNDKTYYIYQIPGRKVGCTENLTRRQKEQESKGELILLETHTDIYRASERERLLQADKGYKVDRHPYWHVVQVKLPKTQTKQAQNKRKESYGDFRQPQLKRTKELKVYKVKVARVGSYNKIVEKTFYKIIKGIHQCKRELKFNHCTGISNVLRGKAKSYKGYTFEYA